MTTDLREALESAMAEVETPEAAVTAESTPAPASSAEPATTPPAASDETAPPAAGPSSLKPSEADAGVDPTKKVADEPATPEMKQSRVDRAPVSWKMDPRKEWGNIPLPVRQEIHRREMQIEKALQETAPARQLAEQFTKTVTPYMARIQAAGASSPLHAVEELLKADYLLASAPRTQKAAYMARLIKEYDVDIAELDNALAGAQTAPAQPQAMDIQALVQEQLRQALAPILSREQEAARRSQEEIEHTVETMALDPKYPHFDDVRADMADLIDLAARRNRAMSLEDAYKTAVLAAGYESTPNAQTTSFTANQQHAEAQRAKAAASSVSGAPVGGAGFTPADNSLRAHLESAFNSARI
jgi:hypothetical protein